MTPILSISRRTFQDTQACPTTSPRRPHILNSFLVNAFLDVYTGRTAIDRLIHIVRTCPAVAPEAFKLAVELIHQWRDPSLYQTLITEYERLLDNTTVRESYTLPNPLEIAQLDTKWVDEITAKNQSEKVRLEVELKTYMNNMIKESIRVSHMRRSLLPYDILPL